jgi:hypothetical protein
MVLARYLTIEYEHTIVNAYPLLFLV